MVLAVVLVAVGVVGASLLLQTPTYEASVHMLVGVRYPAQGTGNGKIQLIPNAPPPEILQAITKRMIHTIDSRPVAREVIQRLGLEMSEAELLDKLAAEQDAGTSFIRLTYEDNDPERAKQIVNTVGEVSSERISPISVVGSKFTATVWEKAEVPESPVSPHPLSNGLLTLVIGLMLCTGLALGLPVVAASVAGRLGRQAVLQGIGQAGVPAVARASPSQTGGIKKKELLQALGRAPSGKLTVTGAALETSLSVGEAEQMLEALAAKGHLQVTVEDGRLHYSLWEPDAHL